ncbi:MAG: glutamine synthetase family protein [Devosia sp.]|nr:glutamine synthetase family protein [Devosia sp.]
MSSYDRAFLADHPEIEVIEAFVIDANGVPRGKWIPRDRAADILEHGMALPRSIYALDVWGRDVNAAGLAEGTGDPDGLCLPINETLAPVTWLSRPTAQVILGMQNEDGSGFYADPRNVLRNVLKSYERLKLTPVVATELEFYLIDPVHSALDPVRPPNSRDVRWQSRQTQVLSISELHEFEVVFAEISRACSAQEVPADTILRENGPGQYEVNLKHVPDALLAADHAVLLKRIVKGVARKHDFDATFMAKPYGQHAGSGMHVHFSLLDEQGRNVFAIANGQPSEMLRHATGGLIATMAEGMAIFAPNANSFRRVTVSEHAPMYASWGLETRSAAVRVVASRREATRIEHRVAGADSNPYLVLAAILGGALFGIEQKLDPGAPLINDNHTGEHALLPNNWDYALELFAESQFTADCLGADYKALYLACKNQELAEFRGRVTDVEYDAFIRTV